MIWVPNATVIKASPNHDREMAGGESANSEDKGLKNEGFAASLGDVFTLPNGGERYIDAHMGAMAHVSFYIMLPCFCDMLSCFYIMLSCFYAMLKVHHHHPSPVLGSSFWD